jgi:hypothetical protein
MPPTITTTPLTRARGCVGDIAVLAQRVPLFPVERTMHLAGLADARAAAPVRIGWATLFLKAYATVAAETPALRSWCVGGLRPRIATSSESVAVLAVNRTDEGCDRLWFPRVLTPESRSLEAIQQFIDRCGRDPVEEVFKRQLELEMLPGPLRRFILRWHMHSRSPKRPSRIGTFSLSTLAGQQAINRFHPTLCTTSLSYGPLEPDGRCLVTIIADHRVLDGSTVARALARLEDVLTGAVREQVRALRPAPPAAAA